MAKESGQENERPRETTATFPRIVILENNENVPDDLNLSEDIAIVRIWTSTANPVKQGEYVGHVSLELILDEKRGSWSNGRSYISVGPDTPDYDILMTKPFHQYAVKYVDNYGDDLKSEGRPPEFTFVFYSLHVVAMKDALEDLLEKYPLSHQRWTIAGPSFSLGEAAMSYWEIFSDMLRWYTGRFSNRKYLQNVTGTDNDFKSFTPDGNEAKVKNVSCVTLVFEILNKGFLSTKLLANKSKRKNLFDVSEESSDESVQGFLKMEYLRILRAAGYALEYGLVHFILSPDVFLHLMVAAKRKELRESGSPKFALKFVNTNDEDSGPYEVIEEIPSLEEHKKRQYYHLMAFFTIAVSLMAMFMYQWKS